MLIKLTNLEENEFDTVINIGWSFGNKWYGNLNGYYDDYGRDMGLRVIVKC